MKNLSEQNVFTLPFSDEDTNSELNTIFDTAYQPRPPQDYDEFIAYLSDLLLNPGMNKENPLLYVEHPQHKDSQNSPMESSVHNMKRSR